MSGLSIQAFEEAMPPAKKNKVPEEVLMIDADSFYDPSEDYSRFSGRVTDRDDTGTVVKVSSENKNARYFRAGDFVQFKIQNMESGDYCEAYIRSIEDQHFVMFVKDLHPCFKTAEYFRRGTALIFKSDKLAIRVREASVYRASLIKKKKDFMFQLNSINQNLFSYEERKVQAVADIDRKISELEKEKIKELDRLVTERNDEIRLQRELAFRLDSIDKELDFYRLDKREQMIDRWHLDQDLGHPVYKRPEDIRTIKN
jgi:hypothetical protein